MSAGSGRRHLLSGVPERRWPDAAVHHGVRWLLLVVLAGGLVILYPSDPGVGIGRYRAGTVAERDIIAQVSFPVPKDSAVLRSERDAAAASVVPTFTYRAAAVDSTLAGLAAFFARVDSASVEDGVAGIAGVLATSGIDADAAQVELLAEAQRRTDLHEHAASAVRTLTPDGLMAPGAASRVTTDSIRVVRNGGSAVVARATVLSGREFYDRALAGMEPGPETDLLRVVLARVKVVEAGRLVES